MNCLSALLINIKSPKYAIIQFVRMHGRLRHLDKMYLRALNNGLLVLNPGLEFFVYTVDKLGNIIC